MLMIADCIPSYYGPTHPETNIHGKSAATHYLTDRRYNLYDPLSEPTYIDPEDGKTKAYPSIPE
jgi:hypothetical protein